MSYERTQSHNPEQLLGPGTPGGRPSASTSDGVTQATSATPPSIRAPLPIIVELDSIVERFRGRQVSKPCAIGLISAKFAFDTIHADPEKDNAFLQYLAILDSTERLAADVTQQGANLQQNPIQVEQGEPAHHSAQPPHGATGNGTSGSVRGVVSGEEERHK